MIKKFFLYSRLQLTLFLSLMVICVIPYILNQTLLNKLIPNLHLIMIILLFGIKILFFKDSLYKKKIKKNIREELIKELGLAPSNKDIEQRIHDYITAKDVVLIAIGVIILILFITL